MTFTTPISLAGGALSAFARLASGTVLVAGLVPGEGGTTAGVAWRSGDGGMTFDDWTLAPMPRLRALAERAGTLYLAGSNYTDGWALARLERRGPHAPADPALRPGERGEGVRGGRLPGPVRPAGGPTTSGRPRCATRRQPTAGGDAGARPRSAVGMRLRRRAAAAAPGAPARRLLAAFGAR